MSSTSPHSFMNLSTSLTSLDLSLSRLQGKFPKNVLNLPNLQRLDLSQNINLNGSFPQYNWSSPLRVLNLSSSGIVIDNIPYLCRKLKYLHALSLSYIPWSSILNLQKLTYLDLSKNNFIGQIPKLYMSSCGMNEFPYFLKSLKNLEHLDLSNNQIEGSVPQWLWNMGKDSLL
ncbi:hypothetical protein F8388_008404, partial [Cannabis sativa]